MPIPIPFQLSTSRDSIALSRTMPMTIVVAPKYCSMWYCLRSSITWQYSFVWAQNERGIGHPPKVGKSSRATETCRSTDSIIVTGMTACKLVGRWTTRLRTRASFRNVELQSRFPCSGRDADLEQHNQQKQDQNVVSHLKSAAMAAPRQKDSDSLNLVQNVTPAAWPKRTCNVPEVCTPPRTSDGYVHAVCPDK